MGTVHITAFYAGILAILLVVLSLRVVVVRVRRVPPEEKSLREERLLRAIRVQGNFIEYVPLALLLLGYLEFMGLSVVWVHSLGLALVVARVLHPFGLRAERGPNFFRVTGALVTWIVLLAEGFFAIVGFLGGSPYF